MGQLAHKLAESNIQPIFAVTKGMVQTYEVSAAGRPGVGTVFQPDGDVWVPVGGTGFCVLSARPPLLGLSTAAEEPEAFAGHI